jgi:Xaa-Pro aminopeptidase
MTYAYSEVLAERHRRLRQSLIERQLDAFVVTHLPNIFYLTNFSGSAAMVLVTADRLYFVTDFRYKVAVESSWATPTGCPDATLTLVQTTYDETLIEVLRSSGVRQVGFEAARVPFAQYGRWAGGLGPGTGAAAADDAPSLVPTERVVESARLRKDASEIATLREAAALLPAVFERVLGEVQAGRSERQVAARIDWVLKDAGFERTAFETIVASGPNGALPHARPGARRLQQGDLVVLDFGGVYDGYCVDLTRTVSVGQPDAEARRVYAAVVEAHAAGVDASRPGATTRGIDRAARGTLERLGLGDAFGHGTGHGLGIEVHEEPWLRRTPPPAPDGVEPASPPPEDVVIESGMVFTIEPGAYLPGWGGVRLEDDVLVTENGPEFLTHVARELAVV